MNTKKRRQWCADKKTISNKVEELFLKCCPKITVSASPRNLLELKIIQLHSKTYSTRIIHYFKSPQWLWWVVIFSNHWSRVCKGIFLYLSTRTAGVENGYKGWISNINYKVYRYKDNIQTMNRPKPLISPWNHSKSLLGSGTVLMTRRPTFLIRF